MERKYLQFYGQVDLADLNISRNRQDHGGEVQDAANACSDESVGNVLRCLRRYGDHANASVRCRNHLL